ncbi:STAS domain-containing protein [Streptosporangium album]|uniref:STAS domain-containing protein n=1 Tax=Streptosporangium album TaxID=47479 RepID=UPI0035E46437
MTPPRVVVDTEGLTFCDSSGLSVLIGALRGMRDAGGQLVLSGVRGRRPLPRMARRLKRHPVSDGSPRMAAPWLR